MDFRGLEKVFGFIMILAFIGGITIGAGILKLIWNLFKFIF